MDIGILTIFYKNYNYGGFLQAYALSKAIESLGYSCEVVLYDIFANKNPVYSFVLKQIKQYDYKSLFAKGTQIIISRVVKLDRETLRERKRRFKEACSEMPVGSTVYDDSSLHRLNDSYKLFVVGSDQVWNPNSVRRLFLCDYVKDKNRKISYAASIGRKELNVRESNVIIPAIEQFSHVSVREDTAKYCINKYIDQFISVVLDPVFLLKTSEWDCFASDRLIEGKYALFYNFSQHKKEIKECVKYCESNGLEPVLIPYAKSKFDISDYKCKMKKIGNGGPREFVSLIRNAECIFTDSFHGAAFSIIFHKPLIIFKRDGDGHASMNSRLHDFANLIGIGKWLVSDGDSLRIAIHESIDYSKVNEVLKAEKERSLDYLRDALMNADIKE